MSSKAEDEKHFDECHERWSKRKNRQINQPVEMPDDWYENQCMFCVYYLLLPGKFALDWGVCSNVKSPMDGKVAFEHDGCDFFVRDNECDSF